MTGKGKEGINLLPRSGGFAGFFPDNRGSMCCHSQGQVCITLPSHTLQRSQLLPSSLQDHSQASLFSPLKHRRSLLFMSHTPLPSSGDAEECLTGIALAWKPPGNSSRDSGGYQNQHAQLRPSNHTPTACQGTDRGELDLRSPSPERWVSWRMRREAHVLQLHWVSANLTVTQPPSHCGQTQM